MGRERVNVHCNHYKPLMFEYWRLVRFPPPPPKLSIISTNYIVYFTGDVGMLFKEEL